MRKALIVIDVQKDYFSDGKFPLWNSDAVTDRIVGAITRAQANGTPVILVQHIAQPAKGPAPFFNAGTEGVQIHPKIVAAAKDAPVVVKEFADSFHHTRLEEILAQLQVDELLVCGMMTQNCVTHTAISKAAEKYKVTVLPDCCTTVSEILHLIALNALSTRVTLAPATEVL
jgi:nicotinamidase-related amidase